MGGRRQSSAFAILPSPATPELLQGFPLAYHPEEAFQDHLSDGGQLLYSARLGGSMSKSSPTTTATSGRTSRRGNTAVLAASTSARATRTSSSTASSWGRSRPPWPTS